MVRAKLNELFGIDPRSLAALRIGLALMLLADTGIRLTEVDAMYADSGLMSIAASREWMGSPWYWSLNYWNGSREYQVLLLVVAIPSAVALLVGWRTWWATLVSWVLLSSVHLRAPLLQNGGDILLRLMLFWSLFVPLGRVWSLDARRNGRLPSLARVVSAGTAALMLQLTFVYLFTAIFKTNDDWFSGKALYYAFSLDWSARPLGIYLLNFPELMKVFTWATLALEWGMAFLVWSPWQTHRLRLAAAAAFFVMHVVIHATMTVGLFSIISIVAWFVFLPREFWESRLLTWLGARLAAFARSSGVKWDPSRAVRARDKDVDEEQTPAPLAPWRRTASWVAQGACLFMIFYVLGINIISYCVPNLSQIPPGLLSLCEVTNTWQKWDMFGRVSRNDGWYAARARLKDGTVVDVLRGGAPYTDDKPPLVSAIFPNQHWRYYFHLTSQLPTAQFHEPTAEYLYRTWNAQHGESQQIQILELSYFHEDAELRPGGGNVGSEKLARITPDNDSDDTGLFDDRLNSIKSGGDYIP